MNTLVELRNAAVGVRMVERGLAAVCGKDRGKAQDRTPIRSVSWADEAAARGCVRSHSYALVDVEGPLHF
jgi:hypothetical protein